MKLPTSVFRGIRFSGLLLVAVLCGPALPVGGTAVAQDGMITARQAIGSGLVLHWFSQLDAADADAIVGLDLVVNEDNATTYFQVSGGGLREVISEHDLSPFGRPFGVDEAREFAGIRKEIFEAQLKRDLKEGEVTIEQFSIPETTLYTASRTGMVNAIDAETGKLRWRVEVGTRELPTIGMAASKKHLAVVNGSNVMCLDNRDGKLLWHRKVTTALAASPVINEHFVFVPTDDGRLEALPFNNDDYARPVYAAIGQPVGGHPPILEGRSVAWSTSRGMTVAPAEKLGSMRFRVNSESPIMAPLASRGGVLFMASRDGFVYATSEATGVLLWKISVGEHIKAAPVPLDEDVLVFTENRNLYRLDILTGLAREGWEKPMPGIRQFVGASRERFYVLNDLGQLVTLDRSSGSLLATMANGLSLRTFSNLQSDRLYVCYQSGMIQCLREAGSVRPSFHSNELPQIAASSGPAVPVAAPVVSESDNPFAESAMPAAGTDTQPQAVEASDDPFATGGNSAASGAANPPANSGGMDPDDPFATGGAATTPPPAASETAPAPKVVVWKDVEAVLGRRCGNCHGANNAKAGFDVTSFAAAMRGGDSGAAIVASDVSASRLHALITHADEPKMPPGGRKIPDAEIRMIESWIQAGALETAPAGSSTPPAAGDSSDPFGGG